jgi:DNA processing protein
VLARSLADAGLAVWSGGALGIDQAAHQGALAARGATVLVAGSGLDVPYPPGSSALFTQIERSGALVSIVADDTPPQRWIFLSRNAVVAAMTSALVVVECPLKSGARNAIAIARKLGRPTWIAGQSPWSPNVETVREELRLGARLLLHVDELLSSLSIPPQTAITSPRNASNRARSQPTARPTRSPSRQLTLVESAILRELARAQHADDLCTTLGLSIADLSVALMSLELEGLVRSEGGLFVAETRG